MTTAYVHGFCHTGKGYPNIIRILIKIQKHAEYSCQADLKTKGYKLGWGFPWSDNHLTTPRDCSKLGVCLHNKGHGAH